MATRKMTFSLPDILADHFVRMASARNRSRYLAEALAQKLAERDQQLIRACEVANRDPEVWAIEREFDAISHDIQESWGGPKTRRSVVGASQPSRWSRD